MKISIICAMDEKKGIGKNNKIPWHLKEDLVRLKNLTKDHVVVLGRKTYDSMVFYYNRTGRPMPGKLYIVITHDKNYKPVRDNAVAAYSLEEAIKKVETVRHSGDQAKPETPESPLFRVIRDSGQARMTMDSSEEEVFIIGGGQIYEQAIKKGLVDRLYLTLVDASFDADTFFPDYSEFKKVVSEKKSQSDKYEYRFLELEK